jgi:hypothetical protein
MIALGKTMPEHEPDEIELLLPWYAAGTLNARDMRRVADALAHDPMLAGQYAEIQGEYAGTIALNESLGTPSMRPMQKLFAAIDADPAQHAAAPRGLGGRILGFFDSVSPKVLAWSASLGALLLLVQAGVIGAVLVTDPKPTSQTASPNISHRIMSERAQSAAPLTRSLALPEGPPAHAWVRFAPDAQVADITALLDNYHALISGGAKSGTFQLQFGSMSKSDFDNLIVRLRQEKIVNFVGAAREM